MTWVPSYQICPTAFLGRCPELYGMCANLRTISGVAHQSTAPGRTDQNTERTQPCLRQLTTLNLTPTTSRL